MRRHVAGGWVASPVHVRTRSAAPEDVRMEATRWRRARGVLPGIDRGLGRNLRIRAGRDFTDFGDDFADFD
jgi:hypothetical protein